MLTTLRIRDLALIESLVVEFAPGLNLLTGETGAGKSILVGALGLIAGGRGESSRVRAGAERAVVEAAFTAERAATVADLLDEHGVDAPAGEPLVIRRELPAGGGGGRVFVNGSPSTVTVLRRLGGRLLELHTQHGHVGLLSPERHLSLLDRFGGHAEAARAVRRAHAAVRANHETVLELAARAAARAERRRELEEAVREIDAVAPRPGERSELDRERERLRNAGELAELLDDAVRLLYDGESSASSQAAAAARRAARLAELDPDLDDLARRIEAAQVELQDAGGALRDYRDRADFDPSRLESIESRRAALDRVCTRFGADEQAVLARRDAAASEIGELAGLEERSEEASRELRAALDTYERAADELGEARRAAAERLGPAVERQLRELAMARARIEVALEPARGETLEGVGAGSIPLSPAGGERAELRLAANPGEPPRPLGRVASGGELSRVMLALYVVLERASSGRTLIFDEVDAGVGGAAADAVGARLARLARRHQVLCVTHLPQVAAHADRHYHVHKRSVTGRAQVEIEALSRERQVEELARMLGGKAPSPASRRNASALLAGARPRGSSRAARPGGPRREA